uniref:RRM domain-containing protein n=1 Tax=Ananas comosus var. bracteatus TaxID=296719 RepID=A0A6V7Q5L5_ANACO|nr:unnamed protein product [Ananas comosus var. bracteatus]
MTPEESKKFCRDAVLLRASKQNPVIQKVKLLTDEKKGTISMKKHSRGVAFVEFKEHEHAIVCLRVLNNNPGNHFLLDAPPRRRRWHTRRRGRGETRRGRGGAGVIGARGVAAATARPGAGNLRAEEQRREERMRRVAIGGGDWSLSKFYNFTI